MRRNSQTTRATLVAAAVAIAVGTLPSTAGAGGFAGNGVGSRAQFNEPGPRTPQVSRHVLADNDENDEDDDDDADGGKASSTTNDTRGSGSAVRGASGPTKKIRNPRKFQRRLEQATRHDGLGNATRRDATSSSDDAGPAGDPLGDVLDRDGGPSRRYGANGPAQPDIDAGNAGSAFDRATGDRASPTGRDLLEREEERRHTTGQDILERQRKKREKILNGGLADGDTDRDDGNGFLPDAGAHSNDAGHRHGFAGGRDTQHNDNDNRRAAGFVDPRVMDGGGRPSDAGVHSFESSRRSHQRIEPKSGPREGKSTGQKVFDAAKKACGAASVKCQIATMPFNDSPNKPDGIDHKREPEKVDEGDGYTTWRFTAEDRNRDGETDSWDTTGDGKMNAFDTDGDGNADAYDTNGDGQADAFESGDGDSGLDTFDTDGDGKADAKDTDNDGVADIFDTDGDRKADAKDTDGDGEWDKRDTDGDGSYDQTRAEYEAQKDKNDNGGNDDRNSGSEGDGSSQEGTAKDTDGDGEPDASYPKKDDQSDDSDGASDNNGEGGNEGKDESDGSDGGSGSEGSNGNEEGGSSGSNDGGSDDAGKSDDEDDSSMGYNPTSPWADPGKGDVSNLDTSPGNTGGNVDPHNPNNPGSDGGASGDAPERVYGNVQGNVDPHNPTGPNGGNAPGKVPETGLGNTRGNVDPHNPNNPGSDAAGSGGRVPDGEDHSTQFYPD